MKEKLALKVEGLSKQYRLGEIGTGTLSHDINRWFHKIRGKEDPYAEVGEVNDRTKIGGDYVWALKDISFEVKEGDVLGIIGKNGAGKSTLLKLLSKITGPTSGSISLNGRMASLLEVGTGFHPELTGKENIFLNGAILGMTKEEISSKYDEIVEFSGCAKYVDTPVKRYSSGMRVRLGFAVAAFLEPEILVVDEVLAVGDVEFQKKAIGKMKDVAGEGRTVLFVSHNLGSVKSLCNKGMYMENGQIAFIGGVNEAIEAYLSANLGDEDEDLMNRSDRTGNKKLLVTNIRMFNENNTEVTEIMTGDYLKLELTYKSESPLPMDDIIVACGFTDPYGINVVNWISDEMSNTTLATGEQKIILEIPSVNLRPSIYKFAYQISFGGTESKDIADSLLNARAIAVIDSDFYKSGRTLRRSTNAILEGKFSF